MREPIPAEERLAVTLRFMATGETFSSLQYQFRISVSSLSVIIPEVCRVIFSVLKDDYLKCPKTPNEWLEISRAFTHRWQLPNCIGAVDGKHVKILHPKHSGSEFFNYKGYFSIVLMAIVDADYKFIFADVGCQGRISDGGVLRNTDLWKSLVRGTLGLPSPNKLPQSQEPLYTDSESQIPFFFAGDDAFSLEPFMMKPFPQKNLSDEQRVFNYRLSRARRVSENAFGILASRFRVFLTTICLAPEKVVDVVLAAVSLHNLLRSRVPNRYTPPGTMDVEQGGMVEEGLWRQEVKVSPFEPLPNFKKGRQSAKAEDVRMALCQYVNGPGQIPWQWNVLV